MSSAHEKIKSTLDRLAPVEGGDSVTVDQIVTAIKGMDDFKDLDGNFDPGLLGVRSVVGGIAGSRFAPVLTGRAVKGEAESTESMVLPLSADDVFAVLDKLGIAYHRNWSQFLEDFQGFVKDNINSRGSALRRMAHGFGLEDVDARSEAADKIVSFLKDLPGVFKSVLLAGDFLEYDDAIIGHESLGGKRSLLHVPQNIFSDGFPDGWLEERKAQELDCYASNIDKFRILLLTAAASTHFAVVQANMMRTPGNHISLLSYIVSGEAGFLSDYVYKIGGEEGAVVNVTEKLDIVWRLAADYLYQDPEFRAKFNKRVYMAVFMYEIGFKQFTCQIDDIEERQYKSAEDEQLFKELNSVIASLDEAQIDKINQRLDLSDESDFADDVEVKKFLLALLIEVAGLDFDYAFDLGADNALEDILAKLRTHWLMGRINYYKIRTLLRMIEVQFVLETNSLYKKMTNDCQHPALMLDARYDITRDVADLISRHGRKYDKSSLIKKWDEDAIPKAYGLAPDLVRDFGEEQGSMILYSSGTCRMVAFSKDGMNLTYNIEGSDNVVIDCSQEELDIKEEVPLLANFLKFYYEQEIFGFGIFTGSLVQNLFHGCDITLHLFADDVENSVSSVSRVCVKIDGLKLKNSGIVLPGSSNDKAKIPGTIWLQFAVAQDELILESASCSNRSLSRAIVENLRLIDGSSSILMNSEQMEYLLRLRNDAKYEECYYQVTSMAGGEIDWPEINMPCLDEELCCDVWSNLLRFECEQLSLDFDSLFVILSMKSLLRQKIIKINSAVRLLHDIIENNIYVERDYDIFCNSVLRNILQFQCQKLSLDFVSLFGAHQDNPSQKKLQQMKFYAKFLNDVIKLQNESDSSNRAKLIFSIQLNMFEAILRGLVSTSSFSRLQQDIEEMDEIAGKGCNDANLFLNVILSRLYSGEDDGRPSDSLTFIPNKSIVEESKEDPHSLDGGIIGGMLLMVLGALLTPFSFPLGFGLLVMGGTFSGGFAYGRNKISKRQKQASASINEYDTKRSSALEILSKVKVGLSEGETRGEAPVTHDLGPQGSSTEPQDFIVHPYGVKPKQDLTAFSTKPGDSLGSIFVGSDSFGKVDGLEDGFATITMSAGGG
ncbi:MAG: hypothetical protein JXR42_00535 [Gammaproteobacteria bacterium]|nr:hypothetical protein [Gammaproteobacteria bacterium]